MLREEFATRCDVRFLCAESNATGAQEHTPSDSEVASNQNGLHFVNEWLNCFLSFCMHVGRHDKVIHGVARHS